MEHITSLKNPKVAAWKALKDRKGRRESGCFLVEGRKMVEEALASAFDVETVLVQEGVSFPDGLIILSAAVSVAPSLKKPDTTRIVLPILVSVTQSGRRAGRLFLWVSVIGKSPFRQAAVSAVPFFPVRRLSSNSPR